MVEGAAHFETAVRLAERAGDFGVLALAQSDLADALVRSDPQAAAEAALSAAALARRTGQRRSLGIATGNLASALIELGRWDEAADVLQEALEVDHLDSWSVHAMVGWLAGLRGEKEGAAGAQRAVDDHRSGEDPQTQASIGLLDALAALSSGDVTGALDAAIGVLERADSIGIGHDALRWAWPLAARAARGLGERATLGTLLDLLDTHPTGHLPPSLRAERKLVAALVASDDDVPGATSELSAVAAALVSLREAENPYQLAQGLVDYAEVLVRADEDGVDAALAEARAIAERLGCPPLLARAASVGARYQRADAPS